MAQATRGCVLIIEDDADIRESVTMALEELGFEVVTAGNGATGLSVMRGLPRPPNLILLDLMMPVMNGWQFLEAMAQDVAFAAVPVVVMSAAKNVPVSPLVVQALAKPFTYETLKSAVRHAR